MSQCQGSRAYNNSRLTWCDNKLPDKQTHMLLAVCAACVVCVVCAAQRCAFQGQRQQRCKSAAAKCCMTLECAAVCVCVCVPARSLMVNVKLLLLLLLQCKWRLATWRLATRLFGLLRATCHPATHATSYQLPPTQDVPAVSPSYAKFKRQVQVTSHLAKTSLPSARCNYGYYNHNNHMP